MGVQSFNLQELNSLFGGFSLKFQHKSNVQSFLAERAGFPAMSPTVSTRCTNLDSNKTHTVCLQRNIQQFAEEKSNSKPI